MQSRDMQNEVNHFFELLRVTHVQVEVCDDKSTVARAGGFYINRNFPRLNHYLNWAWGKVYVNTSYVNSILSTEEQKFLLAHEVAHIYLNHVPNKLPLKAFNELLKQLAPLMSIALDILKLLLHIRGIPPPIAALTKEQELNADIQAVLLTGNVTAATSCLTKLVQGNLESQSHTWEALGVEIPAFTMRERIEEIKRRIGEISQYYGLRFR